jgi:glycosyltransferase involved in cell wall biosynthesis
MAHSQRLRVLLLAEQCNPEWPSLPIVAYKFALALGEICDVVVVTQVRNQPHIERASAAHPHVQFEFIDTEYVAAPLHKVASWLRGGNEVAWSTNMAMAYLPYLEFERQVWKRFGAELDQGSFDIVHRITPMSPALPSWMAGKARQPFVIGPLNGNLDWPAAFASEQRRERERLRRVREVYKVLPFSRRTWRNSDRVLAAFQHTVDDLGAVPSERIVMMAEVGYDDSIFYPPGHIDAAGTPPTADGPLTFLFVGRLVPYKLPEVAVRAFLESPSLRSEHTLRVVGDGPELERLQALVVNSGHGDRVVFEGRHDQAGVADYMRAGDVFVFPSIRELGAGVVVEAMASGMLSIVVDYGAPRDLIDPAWGVKVPMSDLEGLVVSVREAMEHAAAEAHSDRQLQQRRAAVQHARENYRWETKASRTVEIYHDVLTGRATNEG